MNLELNELIEDADIGMFIKSRRIAWLGHVVRLDGRRTPEKISEWKPTGTRIRGRTRKRSILDIEEDMQIMGKKGGENNVRKEQDGRESLGMLLTHSGL